MENSLSRNLSLQELDQHERSTKKVKFHTTDDEMDESLIEDNAQDGPSSFNEGIENLPDSTHDTNYAGVSPTINSECINGTTHIEHQQYTNSYADKVRGDNYPTDLPQINSFSLEKDDLLNLDKIKIQEPTESCPHPTIVIDDDYIKDLSEPWKGALILRMLGKSINYNLLHTKINTMWSLNGRFQLIDLGQSCYILHNVSESHKEAILTEGPWVIQGHYLVVRKWFPNFRPSVDRISSTIVWVRVPELPIEYYAPDIIYSIAASMGEPIKVDYNTFTTTRGKFARFSVQLDLDKPLKGAIQIRGVTYPIEYENFTTICFTCGRVGHRSNDCPTNHPTTTTANSTATSDQNQTAISPTIEVVSPDLTNGNKFGDWMLVKPKKNSRFPFTKKNGSIHSPVESNSFTALSTDVPESDVTATLGQIPQVPRSNNHHNSLGPNRSGPSSQRPHQSRNGPVNQRNQPNKGPRNQSRTPRQDYVSTTSQAQDSILGPIPTTIPVFNFSTPQSNPPTFTSHTPRPLPPKPPNKRLVSNRSNQTQNQLKTSPTNTNINLNCDFSHHHSAANPSDAHAPNTVPVNEPPDETTLVPSTKTTSLTTPVLDQILVSSHMNVDEHVTIELNQQVTTTSTSLEMDSCSIAPALVPDASANGAEAMDQ